MSPRVRSLQRQTSRHGTSPTTSRRTASTRALYARRAVQPLRQRPEALRTLLRGRPRPLREASALAVRHHVA
jgi:hypothetical protein